MPLSTREETRSADLDRPVHFPRKFLSSKMDNQSIDFSSIVEELLLDESDSIDRIFPLYIIIVNVKLVDCSSNLKNLFRKTIQSD